MRGGTYQASLEPLASIKCERIGSLPQVFQSDARTLLGEKRGSAREGGRVKIAAFFSGLLDGFAHFEIGRLGLILRFLIGLSFSVPVEHAMAVRAGMEIL